MTIGTTTVNTSSARDAVVAIHEARRAKRSAEAEEFRAVAVFADHYRDKAGTGVVFPGLEREASWGGDGAPTVAEFCSLELAAAVRMTETAARLLIGDALMIRQRFPQLWTQVMDGQVRVWDAREVAHATGTLMHPQALALDADICRWSRSMGWTRVLALVKARVLELQGVLADIEHERALARRRVTFDDSFDGLTRVNAEIDVADGIFLNAQLGRVASILRQGGSQDSLDVRRAKALGVLASPAHALALLQASLVDELPEINHECPAEGQRGHTCGTITVDPESLLPTAELVIHLTDETVGSGKGLARVDKVGPILAGWVKELVGHCRVSVRPVLNPEMLVATDAYECPPRMREWVTLRNHYEAFPHSKRRSKGLDLDHTEPWRPSGTCDDKPTRADNLGPLTRKTHRAKTSGGWQLVQPSAGVFLWQSPLGFGYLVTPSNSWMIHDPTGRLLEEPCLPGEHIVA